MKWQIAGVIHQQEIMWSFGLRWYALLEANERAQANRIVRETGTQSWVLTGGQICSVGLSEQRVRRKKGPVFVSAAAYFAQIYAQQQVAAIVELPIGKYWFVAAQQGRVLVRGDHCFTDLAQAQAFMASVLADNPKLGCLHPRVSYLQWQDLLEQTPPAEWIQRATLQPRRAMNRRWLVAVFCVGLLMVIYYLWVGWAASHTVVAANDEAVPPPDPREQVLALHPQAVLAPVLEFLYELPAQAMGWSLQQAHCDLVPEHLVWHCAAQYQQAPGASDVEAFLNAQQWQSQAQMVDLQTFSIEFPEIRLGSQPWMAPSQVTLLQFLGYLHKQQAAFSNLSYQHRHQSLATWPGRTALQIQGPLRSAHLLYAAPVHIQWYQAVLRVQPPVQVGMQHSRLNLTLEGAVDDAQLH